MIQQLALQRQGAEDAIEGADPIGRDDHAPPVRARIVVADLAFVARAETLEVGAFERVWKRAFQRGCVEGGQGQRTYVSAALGGQGRLIRTPGS